MPILQIDTNLSMTNVPLDFTVKTCELMADVFESPIKFCVVHINPDQEIYWYGLDGPCVLGTLKLVRGSGKISPEQNIIHAEKLVKHISDNLKLINKKYKHIQSLFIQIRCFKCITRFLIYYFSISISFVEQDPENVTIFNTTVSNFLQNKN